MLTAQHAKLLAGHHLRAKYISADDESVDDEIQILRDTGARTGYSVQIGLGGFFYVNHHENPGTDDIVMTSHGEFRSLAAALRHAAKLAAAKPSCDAPRGP